MSLLLLYDTPGFDFIAYRGKGGPLPVKDGTVTPLADIYRQAMEELGYTDTDCNGRTQTGKQVSG